MVVACAPHRLRAGCAGRRLDGVVPIDYKRAGELLALVDDRQDRRQDQRPGARLQRGAVDRLDGRRASRKCSTTICPDCKYNIVNVPIPDWATKIQPNVQSALLADPTINYVVPIYDSHVPVRRAGAHHHRRSDSVKIATFNGTPFVLDMIQNGQVEMDIGENLDWIAYGLLDAHMRLLCGLPSVERSQDPAADLRRETMRATAGTPAEASTRLWRRLCRGLPQALWKLQ